MRLRLVYICQLIWHHVILDAICLNRGNLSILAAANFVMVRANKKALQQSCRASRAVHTI